MARSRRRSLRDAFSTSDPAGPLPSLSAHITVHLTPRGGRDAIDGWRDGVLYARVSAPALDGRANEALIRLLAKTLGVPSSRLTIVRGQRSRLKQIAVKGISQAEAERRIGG